jgi:hypothetical protein
MDDVGNTCQTPPAWESLSPFLIRLWVIQYNIFFTAFFVIDEHYLPGKHKDFSLESLDNKRETAAGCNIL